MHLFSVYLQVLLCLQSEMISKITPVSYVIRSIIHLGREINNYMQAHLAQFSNSGYQTTITSFIQPVMLKATSMVSKGHV